MQWPETLDLTLDGIAQGGDAVGRWEGRVVFVRGGLPGERALVRLTDAQDAFARAELVSVLEAAPERVAERQPGADQMSWQHIDETAQKRFKHQILADQLAKIGGLADLAVEPTVAPVRPWAYRSSARVHIEEGRLGYHAAGSQTLRPLQSDPLLQPALNDALAALASVLRREDERAEVILRVSETHGYMVAALLGEADLRPLAQRWMRVFAPLAGVALADQPPLGETRLTEELEGLVFWLEPFSFFQVNLPGAAALLGLVREGLSLRGGERLIDLYSGVGTFSLPLARQAADVFGIEEYEGAVENANLSAEENGIANVAFAVGRVERTLELLDYTPGGIVLDPPRRGCNPYALRHIARLAPPRIVYVSCQPATLARDLRALVESGYRPTRVWPVDLFPQTPHVESVVVLEQSEG